MGWETEAPGFSTKLGAGRIALASSERACRAKFGRRCMPFIVLDNEVIMSAL